MMTKEKVLVCIYLGDEHKAMLEATAPGVEFVYCRPRDITDEMLRDVTAIFGNLEPQRLKMAPNLRWIQLRSAGTNGYLEEGILGENVQLSNATGAYGLAISEHMLGAVLYYYKKLNLYQRNHDAGVWKDEGEVKSVMGTTVLVVGLGDIGGEFAKRCKAMGAYTIGVRRSGQDKPDYLDELHLNEKLDELLPRADVVAISVPGVDSTYHMFGKKQLELMKEDAVLLNVGRGTVIDTEALCEVLDTGQFLGVQLDVTDPEPLPEGHKLWSYDNVMITPHICGGNHLPETLNRIVRIASENLEHYLKGEPLRNVVDRETGYRSL